jgi:hypothetical protein
METVRMLVNGQGLSGGEFSDSLTDARFLGTVSTAPRYRFFAVRNTFPGLYPALPQDGRSIPGELYELPYGMLAERLLPREPTELELSIVELADGSGSLAMRMRREALGGPDVVDISDAGGWLLYLDSIGLRRPSFGVVGGP